MKTSSMAAAMTPRMGRGAWLMLLLLSLLWGGSFFFAEIALRDLPPLTVVLGRVGIAALALLAFLRLAGLALPRDGRSWRGFLAMGALNNALPFGLIVWAQTHIDSGLAAILNATTPLFTVLLAHLLTRDERLTPGRLVGTLIGLAGATLLVGPAALAELGRGGFGLAALAQSAVLGAALSYGLAGIYGRRFRALPAPVAAAGMLCASTLMLLPPALVIDRPWTLAPGPLALAAVVALALLCTAAAYLLYFRILAAAGATNLLLVTFLIPVSALLLGILVLGERPQPGAFAGMTLIFAGLAAIDGRLWRWRRRHRSS